MTVFLILHSIQNDAKDYVRRESNSWFSALRNAAKRESVHGVQSYI